MTPKVERTTSKLRIRERKSFGVGFLEGDRQAIGFGALATTLKKRADVVRRHNVGKAAGRRERCIAVAGGDIEDALVAAEIDGLAERLADDLQRGADHGVVARVPGCLLALFDRGEIDAGGLDDHGRWLSRCNGGIKVP